MGLTAAGTTPNVDPANRNPAKASAMPRIVYLTPFLAVAGQLAPVDFAEIARLGFRTVVNNRPDGEEPGQLGTRQEAVHAWRAGLAYRHVPAAKIDVLEDHVLDPLVRVLAGAVGPVLLHCRSGLRSTIMWAALAVRQGALLADVLDAARAAGHDLDAVAEEIAVQARGRPAGAPTAARGELQLEDARVAA